MSFRKRLLVFVLIVLVAGALDALFAPFLVASGVRLWIRWATQRQGLTAEIESVDAPFLRPVTLRNLTVGPSKAADPDLSFRVATVVLDLNLRARLLGKDAPILRSIRADHATATVRSPDTGRLPAGLDWRQWARLLPDEFQFTDLNVDIATSSAAVSFHGVLLSASAIESGRFFAQHIAVTAPLLRQTFDNLRGATSWESAHLTIAGIPLARGLDLEALTIDLSRLTKRRLGIDLQLDTYGGTLRASFQGRGGAKFSIDLAGSAAKVSLAQLSSAIGFLEPITGSVRASKFTFRGRPGEFLDGTASIWMEASDFAWRARRADTVMLGATYYDRRLEVDQLYVRQRQNELTVNGELLWPKELKSWAQLPFRGHLNATIPDLNGFAQLFGASASDFFGALTAHGEVDLVDPEASGRLAWEGQEVTFRGVPLDSLGGSLRLHGRELTLESLEARHADDFLRAEGTVELASAHHFSGRLTGAINDLGAYAPLLPAGWRSGKIAGGATFDWRGDGTMAAHSGTVQLFAHGLQLPVAPLRMPLDLTLEGSYSPKSIFFRTFRLASDRFSLGGFLLLGGNFVELQAFELALAGTPRVSGTLFLPFGLERWRESRSFFAAFDADQKFDVDLLMDHLDLAKLGTALGEQSFGSGILDGKLAAFGPLRALQVTTSWHLENFGSASSPNTIDFDGRLEGARLEAQATAKFGVSDPITAAVSLPLRLEKKRWETGTLLNQDQLLSATIQCPALFLETLPNELNRSAGRGLVTGKIAWSGKPAAPAIGGEAHLFNLSFRLPPPWPEVTALDAQINFSDRAAVANIVRCEIDSIPIEVRGRLTTSLTGFGLTLTPREGEIEVLSQPRDGASLSALRVLGEGRNEGQPLLREALVRGTFAPASLSLTTTIETDADGRSTTSQSSYFLQPNEGETSPLLLRITAPEPAVEFELGREKSRPDSR
jgi:hypothetical protein